MTNTPDFASRLAKREPVAEPEPERKEPAPRKQKLVPGKEARLFETKKGTSREGKAIVSAWADIDMRRWLKQEALDHNTTMDALVNEALNDLRRKRRKH